MKSGWQKYLLYASIVIVGGFILFETVRLKNTGFEGKSLWDWMELLIIPLVLALGAFYLNRSERNNEREIAADRQQEAALQTYFDRMSELLLQEKLRTTKKAEVRDVARTRTLSIMRVLDTKRNNLIIQFLREARLITDEKSILNSANLKDMDLKNLNLSDAYLQDANLVEANLVQANLWRANFRGANLVEANLQGAFLEETNLDGANLMFANLESAYMGAAKLQGANLEGANLQSAVLRFANLEDADLRVENLRDTDLRGAILRGAILMGTDLRFAKNITREQLTPVKSLRNATMPDGTIHE